MNRVHTTIEWINEHALFQRLMVFSLGAAISFASGIIILKINCQVFWPNALAVMEKEGIEPRLDTLLSWAYAILSLKHHQSAVAMGAVVISTIALLVGCMGLGFVGAAFDRDNPTRSDLPDKASTLMDSSEHINDAPQFRERVLHILLFFLPNKTRANVIGDLEEEYGTRLLRFGRTRTSIWYYSQVFRSLWPFLTHVTKRLFTRRFTR